MDHKKLLHHYWRVLKIDKKRVQKADTLKLIIDLICHDVFFSPCLIFFWDKMLVDVHGISYEKEGAD